MTYYPLDLAPNGSEQILVYGQADMEEIFTEEQRRLIAEGEMVFHRWPRGDHNHIIIDMTVAARDKFTS